MSEHLVVNPEHDKPESKERSFESKAEEDQEQRAESKERSQDDSIETIRQKIHETAKYAGEVPVDVKSEADDRPHHYVNGQLKSEALRRSLNRTRKHLSKPQQALSRAIHQPTIDAISEVGAKTIARPSCLLTGSIIALGGSIYLLYTAKHYGYQYNYFSVILLFAAGYLAGLIIELLAHTLHHRSK